MTLTDFLLARIAEDEATALAAKRYRIGEAWAVTETEVGVDEPDLARSIAEHVARHQPNRVLAECEAKRRIVWTSYERGDSFDTAIRLLAGTYADHPDYREEWRP